MIGAVIDRIAAFLAAALLSPLFVALAATIACRDGRPILFRQQRVGLGGKPFEILKFRSMGISNSGPLTSRSGDKRVTANGKFLRRWKLDELPQLWNVVRGDMRFVGPRPELKRYVDLYDKNQRAVLEYTPGITDVASLTFRDEESLLASAQDPQRYYVEELMPEKIRLNLAYAIRRNIWSDLCMIANTVLVVAGLKTVPFPDGFKFPQTKNTQTADE
jgi:lipopolysaccharide/colanic/teichoic acid biosynthesis glycosyltransferase